MQDHPFVHTQVLRHRDEALLVRTKRDLDSGLPTSFDIFYALLPATNAAALIAKRHACPMCFHTAPQVRMLNNPHESHAC